MESTSPSEESPSLPDETWPGEQRRNPSRASATWLVRAAIARWLRSEADQMKKAGARVRVLDVGCGVKPYFPFFAGVATEYIGLDVVPSSVTDVVGSVEDIPLEAGRFDLVLCTQVLEHCDDPGRAVAELNRVTAPGGRVLASTHGVQVYHPSPHDYWRWTHEGLHRLFSLNAEWEKLEVRPAGGTAACLGMLLGTFVEIGCRRARAPRLARAPVWILNQGGQALDRRVSILREPIPGALFANLHVTAIAPGRR